MSAEPGGQQGQENGSEGNGVPAEPGRCRHIGSAVLGKAVYCWKRLFCALPAHIQRNFI